MAALIYRLVKGSPRTFAEDDQNLININTALLRAPQLVAQSYTPKTRTSTNTSGGTTGDDVYNVIDSATMIGGTMGLNSKLIIIPDWDYPNAAPSKFMGVDFGSQNISVINITTGTIEGEILLGVKNLNSLSLQKTRNGSSYGVSNNARIATTVDTSQDVVIDFKVKWSAAQASATTITLLGYSIFCYPGNT